MTAAAFKDRLRVDLKAALQSRDNSKARVLRILIAIDNAEAVEVSPISYQSRPFGDVGSEVPHRVLATEKSPLC